MTAVAGYTGAQVFAAELVGTFVLVVLATGTIVYDAQTGGGYGLYIAAAGPFVALVICVGLFGKVSLAHFNPAVTIAYYVTGHTKRGQLAWYLSAEMAGAVLGSLFVMAFIGTEADLGANVPNRDLPVAVTFPVEVLASAMLMGVILYVVYTRGLRGFGGVAIGGIVALDILLMGNVSGASMNPARAFAPAVLSGAVADLWLYWTAPFAGTVAAAVLARRRFRAREVRGGGGSDGAARRGARSGTRPPTRN